ncbi:MAG TPA: FMN-binding protein [Acholeplasmataceae bacterium]|nr:FMN-binding protein [Acholeplasmataceae bacterium]
MKKLMMIVLGVIISFVLLGVLGIAFLQKDMSSIENLSIDAIDLSLISDGTYQGTYSNGRFTTTIEVVVDDHVITDLIMIDDVTFVKEDVTEALFDAVMSSQNLDVDLISGATITCKAYLKAIENALKEGMSHV